VLCTSLLIQLLRNLIYSEGSCYLMTATPASYTSKEPPTSLPAFIDSKPARGRHGVGYVFENKCTAGTTVA